MAPIISSSLQISTPNTSTPTPTKQLLANQIDNDDKKLASVEARLTKTVDDSARDYSSTLEKVELKSKSYKIWMSNVVVQYPKKGMLKREWHYKGARRLLVLTSMHVLAMFGPLTFNWGVFWLASILHLVIGMLGITLSFHRNLSHRSFTLPKWLEYLFAYFGSLALQGDPIGWVSTHRSHHKSTETERDPHSPIEGFWHSHITWIFDHNALAQKRGGINMAKDLEAQQFYRFMRSTYLLHHIALGLLLYVYGGFSYFVWGMGVRITCGFHTSFIVNSVCHVWGNEVWNTGDLSKNNWWAAFLTGGEGWHNNHHAFDYSARLGLEWWQIDLTWYTIMLLQTIGLATDVKLPTEAHKQRLAFKKQAKET